ncbi:LysR family transcriptional regulator [Robinsoniella peoriensis]|uniref:LysR family transcriptional regulator n=1 Tax=Robinsoniella peoriensis TaxID=180332 RepID=UPI00362EE437
MEIRVLNYFLTVVREESISKAAAVLHITQPTLSRQLAQLEEAVGVTLFHRGTRKITLTSEGILLRRRAQEILELVDITERELAEQEELIEGKISIGCGELASVGILSELFDTFSKKYPSVNYDLFTANADQIRDRMDNGLTDIGLLLEPVDMDKYDFIRLDMKESWVVLMRPDDPLARKEYVTAADLSGLPIIMVRRPNVQSELASWFGDYFKDLHILFTSNLSTNGAVMVYRGLGYSLVVEGSLPFLDKEKICYRPLFPELTATSVLAWKRGQPFGPAAAKFIEHIKCFLSMSKT